MFNLLYKRYLNKLKTYAMKLKRRLEPKLLGYLVELLELTKLQGKVVRNIAKIIVT